MKSKGFLIVLFSTMTNIGSLQCSCFEHLYQNCTYYLEYLKNEFIQNIQPKHIYWAGAILSIPILKSFFPKSDCNVLNLADSILIETAPKTVIDTTTHIVDSVLIETAPKVISNTLNDLADSIQAAPKAISNTLRNQIIKNVMHSIQKSFSSVGKTYVKYPVIAGICTISGLYIYKKMYSKNNIATPIATPQPLQYTKEQLTSDINNAKQIIERKISDIKNLISDEESFFGTDNIDEVANDIKDLFDDVTYQTNPLSQTTSFVMNFYFLINQTIEFIQNYLSNTSNEEEEGGYFNIEGEIPSTISNSQKTLEQFEDIIDVTTKYPKICARLDNVYALIDKELQENPTINSPTINKYRSNLIQNKDKIILHKNGYTEDLSNEISKIDLAINANLKAINEINTSVNEIRNNWEFEDLPILYPTTTVTGFTNFNQVIRLLVDINDQFKLIKNHFKKYLRNNE